MVLNMISTCAMVKTGKVRGNLMINLRPTNHKISARMIRIVREELGVGEDRAVALLDAHDWALRPTLDSVTSHNT